MEFIEQIREGYAAFGDYHPKARPMGRHSRS